MPQNERDSHARIKLVKGRVYASGTLCGLGIMGGHTHIVQDIQADKSANGTLTQFVACEPHSHAHHEAAQCVGVAQRVATRKHGNERILLQIVEINCSAQYTIERPPNNCRIAIDESADGPRLPQSQRFHELLFGSNLGVQPNYRTPWLNRH
jgi:hypothetical protein